MKVTNKYYNECVNKTMKKLNNENNWIKTLVYNATAYSVERCLFEGGRYYETIYFNDKDFIETAANATLEIVNSLLQTKDLIITTKLTLDVAEFCTELCEEIFRRKDY